MPKITPFLWFNNNADEAMRFYASVFPNSKITASNTFVTRASLDGQEVVGLNGGPQFPFSEAFSFVIDCENQDEVDYYWSKLTADGGSESRCGWLKDKYGLSWQVVPKILSQLLGDPTSAPKVTQAFMKMNKLVISELVAAAR